MNKFLLSTFLFFSLLLSGCLNKTEHKTLPLSKNILEKTVLRAINGVSSANDSLSKLIDYSFPLNADYNKLSIDSLSYENDRVLFTVLMTYNNPIYNRFAVYNKNLELELIDKSLNGQVYKENLYLNGMKFLKLTEDFLSKDIFNLTRISIYKIDSNSVNLVFRTLSKLKVKGRIYTQDITEITNDRIKTKLNSTVRSSIRNKSDVFTYSSISKKYEPTNDLFHNYVINKINKSRIRTKLPLITDKKSALAMLGITEETVVKEKRVEVKSSFGFSIKLSKTWKRFDDFMIRTHLIKGKRGTRFVNTVLGTKISIIKIEDTEDVNEYTKYPFVNETNAGIKRISTEKMIYGKSFYRLFEYIGKSESFLLIIEGSKYTYDKYKNLYNNIINSFKIIDNV